MEAKVDGERLKRAVISALEESLDGAALARAVSAVVSVPGPAPAPHAPAAPARPAGAPSSGAQKLLAKIVLSDLLDDAILAAKPDDRTFPLRLFFAELGRHLATDADEGPAATHAELAFCLASGLNFFFRAKMDGESKVRAALETSRAFYAFAYGVPLDAELTPKAAPLLASLLGTELDKVRLEAVDHAKVFDSQVHERTPGSDPTSSRIVRPETFLCRVAANGAVKAKAQVLT